jgi:sodium/bile acid cotransporter 7
MMRGRLFLLIACLSVGCGTHRPEDKLARIESLYRAYAAEFPAVPETTVAELVDRREDIVLVDAREAEEQAVSVIPGAVPQADLDVASLQGRRVVVYCTIGYRSGLAAKTLRERGVEASNLKGGVLLWTHAGQELVGASGQPTRRVHVYGSKWDLAADGYEAVW